MSTHEHSRRAHELVDAIKDGYTPDRADVDFLRSFLPELPKQKTLEALRHDVHDVWAGVHGNEWPDDMYCDLETWLYELHQQLKGLAPAKSVHPEFLETEADYRDAPEGTIVDCEDSPPWHKFDSEWISTAAFEGNSAKGMTGIIRRVLRWGDGE